MSTEAVPPGDSALVLVAHADDETLGAGGTIQHLVATGWQVRVVILADGIVRARGIEQDNRSDAGRACRLLGVGEPVFVGIPDQRFDEVPMADFARRRGGLSIGFRPRNEWASHFDLQVAALTWRPVTRLLRLLAPAA